MMLKLEYPCRPVVCNLKALCGHRTEEQNGPNHNYAPPPLSPSSAIEICISNVLIKNYKISDVIICELRCQTDLSSLLGKDNIIDKVNA